MPVVPSITLENRKGAAYIGAARIKPAQVARLRREELEHGAKTDGRQKMEFPPKYHEPLGSKWKRWMSGITRLREDRDANSDGANDHNRSGSVRQDSLPEYIA